MAKVKVVNTNLDQNLNGTNFLNTASETIFQFGKFNLTSNFDGRTYVDYTNTLSTFVRPVTLETLGVSTTAQSNVIFEYDNNAVLNLNKSDLNTFIRYGSAYEFLRISIQNIILKYPGSLFVNNNIVKGGNITFDNIVYDELTNTTTFETPSEYIVNVFGLAYNKGNTKKPDDLEIKNINLSYDKYVVWSTFNPNYTYPIIGFTGDSLNNPNPYITVKTEGCPFPINPNSTVGYISYHIKPNNFIFEEFRAILDSYEQYIVSQRNGTDGFQFIIKDPTLLDDGTITYANKQLLWPTSDGYNIDINNSDYQNFLDILLTIGSKYDSIKTDLIARFLTPASLKTYDLTEEGKMTKFLRVCGREFDQIRTFIDSLVYINTVTYDKINNIPDQLVSNMARTFGWDYFNLVNEAELVDSFFNYDNYERNLGTDLTPAEINVELWRRILINTSYFWKSKGTRQAIKAMFLLIGIPEPFINITEYVYTVDGKIDPNEVTLSQSDFPTDSLPYDTEGYPVAPVETNYFYFQVSGNTDSGQEYLNVFRKAGFNLNQTVDNKKSWIQTGSTTRVHPSTIQYYQEDSKLVINTKEIDVALDTAQGIEYDVYNYMKIDYSANSSGYTLPYAYVNISLAFTGLQNTFNLPSEFNKAEGDLEVRYNGILLNAPKESNYDGITGGTYVETTQADYTISGNTFTLINNAINANGRRDVIEATYLYSGTTANPISGVTVKYTVVRVKPNLVGTTIPLPSKPNGDVQLTLNGIALTKGTGQFIADYIVDPNDSSQLVIQNPEVIAYMAANPYVQLAYVTVTGSTSIAARNEIVRVDSLNSSKIYFNNSANKYVYRLNYMVSNARDVKVLVDGIALEPQTDYSINVNNKYEIYLPRGLRYGSVISVYYIVAGGDYFNPIISNDFGVGDIGKMSFLEFIEFIQRKLINATNRKIITDFKGGWYPTLLSIYIQYLERGRLPYNNPLHSNGYTFENLYPFLSKYNTFFNRFVDQLLPATIIIRKGGLLVRNTVFTRQKYAYKRGVYMGHIKSLSNTQAAEFTYDNKLSYFGDDGSTFLKRPLSQQVEWNGDFVCVDDLCKNFVVSGITITYPTDTTITTEYPYNPMMLINESMSSQLAITNAGQTGWYSYANYLIEMLPSVLPGYTVTANLQFTSKLYITGGTNNLASTIITVKKNGTQIYDVTNQVIVVNSGDTINNTTISFGNGDIVEIIIENQALKAIGSPVGIVTSTTNMIPTINNIIPNGSVSIITPPIVTNTTPIP